MFLFYVWIFLGGAFFANAIPHFVQGVCGNPFPSPFAKPPGRGNSSPIVNVVWGSVNFVGSYLLLYQVAEINFQDSLHALVFGAGGLLMGLMTGNHFGKVRN
jgi:hypothetical protein